MVAAGMGWLEVALLRVRFAEVWLGIRQGKIVDCGGYLSVGLVGWQASAREMAHGFSHRGPCLYWCQLWFQ